MHGRGVIIMQLLNIGSNGIRRKHLDDAFKICQYLVSLIKCYEKLTKDVKILESKLINKNKVHGRK